MFVSCSTLCFTREPLESAFRHIAELEFSRIDLAIVEDSPHLKPSEVAADLDAALHRIRYGPSLTPTALNLDFGPIDDPAVLRKRFEAMCRLAKPLTVAVLTMKAAPRGTPLEDEVKRLTVLAEIANVQGLVLSMLTHSDTVTALPADAIALCDAVPGLGLTLDPSHFIHGPNQNASYDDVFPYVQDVHFRDTSVGQFQVRIGQGEIEYGRVVNQLERHGYDRSLTVAIHDTLDTPFDVEVEVRKLKLLLESLL